MIGDLSFLICPSLNRTPRLSYERGGAGEVQRANTSRRYNTIRAVYYGCTHTAAVYVVVSGASPISGTLKYREGLTNEWCRSKKI